VLFSKGAPIWIPLGKANRRLNPNTTLHFGDG
jgi:hypothetical protein